MRFAYYRPTPVRLTRVAENPDETEFDREQRQFD